MGKLLKRLSLLPQGLKYKLLIAFTLMSIIPLLVLGYVITNHIQTQDGVSLTQITVIVLLSVIISWLGLVLAKNLVDPIIDMSIEARMIASGDFERKIHVTREDEIGELAVSINLLTKRIKDNVQELRDYGEKTREINLEIQRKMMVLNNVLHIGDLISASVDLEKVLDESLEKLSEFYDEGFAIAYLLTKNRDEFKMKAYNNFQDSELLGLKINVGKDFLGQIAQKRKIQVIDSSTPRASIENKFKNKHKLMNLVIVPLFSGKNDLGLILLGNRIKEFTYTNEDIDTIRVFARQLSIAVENDVLVRKAETLAIKDELTGVFNKNYIIHRLNEELGRALLYQRPCSFVLVDIDDFSAYRDKRGQLAVENVLKKLADVLIKHLGPVDKAARIGDDEFALLLPEKNKKAALDVSEKIRQDVECLSFSEDALDRLTVSLGVSENPLDGSTADELLARAMENVKKAKKIGKNKVVL